MTPEDPRPLLTLALDQAGRLVTTTDPARAADPTPCPEFTVAQLVGHLVGVARRVAVVLSGRPAMSVPSTVDSTDWAGDWSNGRAELDPLLAEADLGQPVSVPWGTVPAGAAMAMYAGEFAVHAWDLAAATGRLTDLDERIAGAALPSTVATIPERGRGAGVPFGPVVSVGAQAGAYERLVAWTGRDPGWSAPE